MHHKGSHKQDKKTVLRIIKNIWKQNNWQGIDLQNAQTARATQYQNNRQQNKKGIKPKEMFLQRKHIDGQQIHVKLFNITIREMQFKTTVRYHQSEVTPVRRAIIKKLQTINSREVVERMEPSYTVGSNINWYSHYGEQYGNFSKNLK